MPTSWWSVESADSAPGSGRLADADEDVPPPALASAISHIALALILPDTLVGLSDVRENAPASHIFQMVSKPSGICHLTNALQQFHFRKRYRPSLPAQLT